MGITNTLITTYLETLKQFTEATSVNLCFIELEDVESRPYYFHKGQRVLPEFDDGQPQITFPLVKNTLNKETPYLEILPGDKANSSLIYFEFSIVEQFIAPPPLTGLIENRRKILASSSNDRISLWIGLDFKDLPPKWLSAEAMNSNTGSKSETFKLLKSFMPLGAIILKHTRKLSNLLSDPVTSLSGRIEFQINLAQLISQFSKVALVLVHPAEFQRINNKFGHDSGDQVISEIAQNLKLLLRESDHISRFGGALFAIAAPLKHANEIINLVEKLQSNLQQPDYLGGATSLHFNVGASVFEKDGNFSSIAEPEKTLIQRADIALRSAQAEPDANFVLWHPEENEKYPHGQDYIGGIFTADAATDYRNMLLLWDISNLIASHNRFETLFIEVIQRLAQTFNFTCSGILNIDKNGALKSKLACEIGIDGTAFTLEKPDNTFELMLQQTLGDECQLNRVYKTLDSTNIIFSAPCNELKEGVFYIIGEEDRFELERDSQLLLSALAKQLGRAIARAQLEEQLNEHLLREKQKLQTELTALKLSVQSSRVLYSSKAMSILMKQARRAAMIDTTTLIIGESGTGKERLVQAMHQEGARHDKPLVIVDCSAIPETLIESELFGHAKGAYTGAQSQSKGRILEAANGTLMLDEIGELPLQMQSKLLRFVQEKQMTPVGSNKTITVDVKIIAVTNRELQEEVNQGRFRQDLFYRLNVLVLRTPPLRERTDDISLLADHFLKKYSHQYEVAIKKLSTEAKAHMLNYDWPGNVRELENRIMQAVLLCEGNEIGISDLKISSQNKTPITPVEAKEGPVQITEKLSNNTNHFESLAAKNSSESESFIAKVHTDLSQEIQQVLDLSLTEKAPIGQWLDDDLLSATFQACNQNAGQTAIRLGMSHSTLRRRINKINTTNSNETQHRTAGWHSILDNLDSIANGRISIGDDSIKQLKLILLSSILKMVPNNAAKASALLGVSEPTFYKMKKELAQR